MTDDDLIYLRRYFRHSLHADNSDPTIRGLLIRSKRLYNLAFEGKYEEYERYEKFHKENNLYSTLNHEIAFKHLYNEHGIEPCIKLCENLRDPSVLILHYSMLGHRYFDLNKIDDMCKAYDKVINTYEQNSTEQVSKSNNLYHDKGMHKWYISTLFYYARHIDNQQTKIECLRKIANNCEFEYVSLELAETKYLRAIAWLKCFTNNDKIVKHGLDKAKSFYKKIIKPTSKNRLHIILNEINRIEYTDKKHLNKDFKEKPRRFKEIGRTKEVNFVGNP